MGSCTSSSAPLDQARPSAATLSAAAGNSYGATVNIGCSTGGSVANNVGCPSGWSSNGETGFGSCHYCSANPGTASNESSGCTSGSCAIVGARLQCKLTSYLGDQATCCQTGASATGSGTCNPNWGSGDGYASGNCDATMQSYCTTNNYANWNNTQCQKWYTARAGQDAEKALMLGFCKIGDNIKTNAACAAFCQANPGMCDTQAAAYCAVHPEEREFCACYNLADEFKSGPLTAGAAKPSCYVPACSNGATAYRSATMVADAKSCAPIAVCNQTLNAKMTNAEIQALNQTCTIYTQAETQAKSTANNSSNNTNNSTTGTAGKSTTIASKTDNTEIYYIAGGLVAACLLLSCIGVIGHRVFSRGGKKKLA